MKTRIALVISAMLSVYVGVCLIIPGFEFQYLGSLSAGILGSLLMWPRRRVAVN